jgi:hypothetical protein
MDDLVRTETLIVAFLLACVPYLLIRGPVGRIAHTRQTQKVA